jgi:hypothetical protein
MSVNDLKMLINDIIYDISSVLAKVILILLDKYRVI